MAWWQSVCLGNRFLRPSSFWNCDPLLFVQEFLLPVWSLFLQCGCSVKAYLRKEERGKERGEKEKPVPKNQLQRKEREGLLSGASTRAARSSPCYLSSLTLSSTVSRSVMALITRTFKKHQGPNPRLPHPFQYLLEVLSVKCELVSA